MDAIVIEKIREMDLKEGDIVRFDVEDLRMEIRVLPRRSLKLDPPSREALENIMIEPPFELPHENRGVRCIVRPAAELPHLVIPVILTDEEVV